MSGKVVGYAFERPEELTPTQRYVLVALADNADTEGKCWPSKETIISKTGLSRATVYRALDRLAELGLFEQGEDEKGRECFWLKLDPSHHETASPSETEPSHPETPASQSEIPSIQGTVSEPSKEPSRPEIETLCELMAELCRERTGSTKIKVIEAWRVEMRRLIDLDGRTPEQIEHVIRWVHASSFWGPNVLGVPKLREKFDTLVGQIQRDAQKATVTEHPASKRIRERMESAERRPA